MKRFLSWGIICTLFLAACTVTPTAENPQPAEPTATQPVEEPPQPTEPATEVPEATSEPTSTAEAYPLPSEAPAASDNPVNDVMPAYLLPQSGDEKFARASVFLDPDSSGLIVMESSPVQVILRLVGSLPTPCHQLRVAMTTSVEQKRVDIELYSLTDPDMVCMDVLSPFESNIPLGSFSGGKYLVYINGELFGEFDA